MSAEAKLHNTWPKIGVEIARLSKNCVPCVKRSLSRSPYPFRTDIPSLKESIPMDRVGLDYFSSAGKKYQVMVDDLSGFLIVRQMPDMTINLTIRQCQKWFCMWGYRVYVRSDGGPAF
jgi:hypothetical protein